MNGFFARHLPWFVVGGAALFLMGMALPPADPPNKAHPDEEGMRLNEFGRLPVQQGGRIMPMDTAARDTLMLLNVRQTFTEAPGVEQSAVKWLLDVMSSRAQSFDALRALQVVRIDDARLRDLVGLPPRDDPRYLIREIPPMKYKDLVREVQRAEALAPQEQKDYDKAVLALADRIGKYNKTKDHPPSNGVPEQYAVLRIENDQVLGLFGLEPKPGLRYSFADLTNKEDGFENLQKQVKRSRKLAASDRDVFDEKALELKDHLDTYLALSMQQAPNIIPAARPDEKWLSLREALEQEEATGKPNEAARSFNRLLHAYLNDDAKAFNNELEKYRAIVEPRAAAESAHGAPAFEAFFNEFAPFWWCAVLYVLVFVLTGVSWIAFAKPLNRSAFWLTVFTLAVHTWALGARMVLMDRPFVMVTNLYSSAIYIGWGCAVLGLVLELIYHEGIGLTVASVAGFVTMVIANFLAMGGDTLEMMRAVLDTNFWLATHVTCVTSGYAATFVAGLLGMIFIFRGLLTTSLSKESFKALGNAIYGVACFATLLSFVGTVLGGIWADQSWGRFWGWDPKENGALIIVIWNALLLHARWGGLVKQRGLAVLAVVGNIVTIWSWFGVNQLGVGLHSYGFTTGTVLWLTGAVFVHLAIIGVGLIPMKLWASYPVLQGWSAPAAAAAATAVVIPPPAAHGKRKRRGRQGPPHIVPAKP